MLGLELHWLIPRAELVLDFLEEGIFEPPGEPGMFVVGFGEGLNGRLRVESGVSGEGLSQG